MEKKRRLPVLTIMQTGNPEFERYVIEDQQDHQWTGDGFGEAGLLYDSVNSAATDMQGILKSHFKGVEPQRYLVPLFVEVYSNEPVHVAEVVRHLSRATRLWPHYRWVAFAQGPYFVWVSIATVLQLSITAMNWGRP